MRVVLIGGAGFLGRHTISELRDLASARGIPLEITSFDLRAQPLSDHALLGDVTDAKAVQNAVKSADVVVHMASMIDWGLCPKASLDRVNVHGTHNVIAACRAEGVRALLYTSSMDVLLDGRDKLNVDEDTPYPSRFQDAYCETKAVAERAVLVAHGAELTTCVLRPCGMFGEGDPYHLANVLRAAKRGIPFRIGAPRTLFQHVYVGNVAHAHALAVLSLGSAEASPLAGKAYFCTDAEAENFFEFLRPFVEAKGYRLPPPERRLPDWFAFALGAVSESVARAVSRWVDFRPGLTRSSVLTLTRSVSVRSDRLSRDLSYIPRYSPAEAFARTTAYYAQNEP